MRVVLGIHHVSPRPMTKGVDYGYTHLIAKRVDGSPAVEAETLFSATETIVCIIFGATFR